VNAVNRRAAVGDTKTALPQEVGENTVDCAGIAIVLDLLIEQKQTSGEG